MARNRAHMHLCQGPTVPFSSVNRYQKAKSQSCNRIPQNYYVKKIAG